MAINPFQWIRTKFYGIVDNAAGWYYRNGFYKLAAAYGNSGATWAGEAVDENTALTHSVVFACRRRICESVGLLPLEMMQQTSNGKVPALNHPAYLPLKRSPNPEMSSMTFREVLTGHCMMRGDLFAQIVRKPRTGEAFEFWPLMPEQVTVDREKSGAHRLVYVVKQGNTQSVTYTVDGTKPQDILHVPGLGYDGYHGYPVLEIARQSVATALATERYVGRFFGRGGRPPFVVKIPRPFKNKEDGQRFRGDLEQILADPHQAPIVDNSQYELQDLGITLQDMQMIAQRQFSIPEICRWFSISPHMVGDLSRATFSNIEHLSLEFKQYTLDPWLHRWEENLWRCVLTPEEKNQGYYFKFNVEALLRGDFVSRMAGYATGLQNAIYSPNEVRDLEDMNPYAGGGEYHLQLNMQPNSPAHQELARRAMQQPADAAVSGPTPEAAAGLEEVPPPTGRRNGSRRVVA